VVGKDATRTPTGRFYITDKTDKVPSTFYGPHILPLNGYSEQLDIFDDGVPVIALHGTSRPDQLGQAVSNGCVRLPNEVVTLLNDELPIGTQVEIYA
jgi:lipoprotein-anchoring transpeptidase ErfK/SrfK